jgi:modulator of FtsH protease HflC
MRTAIFGLFLIVAGAIAAAGLFSAFIVDQMHTAIILQFGKPVNTLQNGKQVTAISEPGLYWRVPFIQTVVQLDKRILDLETGEKEVIASDQKRLVVDAFARYRITDPLLYVQSYPLEEAAHSQLTAIVNSTIRRVLGRVPFIDVIRNKREELMKETRELVNAETLRMGVEVVDVRIRRADLPEANSQAIYRRMRTEREREAQQLRAEGSEQLQRIRATADKDVTVLLANASRDAEQIRGEGDAERNRIYADAFGKDKDFFGFYRSMQAYEEGLKNQHTRMVITPDSEFFRYFNGPSGNGKGGAASDAAAH